jgi:hypothetical protein
MRLVPLSGVAFVGCFAVAAALYGGGAGSSAASISAYYAAGDGHRQIAGFAVLLAGTVCLLHFVAVLRRELVREEPLATVALASGIAAAALLLAANALWAATAFAVELEPAGFRVDPGAHLLVEDAAFALVVTAAATAIPLVVATTLAARRSGWAPPWLTWLGAAAAAALAAAYWYVPLAIFLAWLAAVSLRLAAPAAAPARRVA